MKQEKATEEQVFQNAVKQAMPQTYRSCEAPGQHNQPASTFASDL